MEKIKIIENPSSGRQGADRRLDKIIKLLIDGGYTVNKFQTRKKDDAMNETIKACKEDWDRIIVSGGDGTVNEVAKGIVYGGRKIPVAILSTGTVNDFANYLKIPKTAFEFFEMLEKGKIIDVDLGKMDDNFFVNVAAGGLLSKVGYKVQPEAKFVLGRMAYYLEGLKEITTQGFEPVHLKIESKEYTGEENALLFLISNTSSIGGFKKIAPSADVTDGFLDVIIIKKSALPDVANIFINIFSGEHINHPNVLYFKTKSIKIESEDEVFIDIDGEFGGKLPTKFEILENAFRVVSML